MPGDNSIFFMLGRFQPFTLGHLALLNSMLMKASKESGSEAYLFVSHKMSAGSTSKVKILEQAIRDNRDMSVIKELMKTKNSIMDYPLHASQRVALVLTLLSKIYGIEITASISGETVIEVNGVFNLDEREGTTPLPNSVKLHVIDCSKVDETAGYMAHVWLKRKYGDKKARMVTGSNRVLSQQYTIIANNPVYIERNETNSSNDNHYTKLSGSKIRSWSVMLSQPGNEGNLAKIKDSYYSLLTEDEVLALIVKPINDSIFRKSTAPLRTMSIPRSRSRGPSGTVRPLSRKASTKLRTKRRASSPPQTNSPRINNSRRRRTSRRT